MENRLTNSKKNVSTNLIIYFVQSLLTFVVRTVFIKKLGGELLGLDSLLINILTMLSIVELGFGNAICYVLYKPLNDNNKNKISVYMSLYKKIYRVVGIVIICIGLVLSLFLKNIVGDYSYKNLYLVYFMYLFYTGFLYFFSYKEVLLLADQKNYKIFKYNIVCTILIYILQLIFLVLTKNYILYVLIYITLGLINRILINMFITKFYKDIDFNSKEKLSKDEVSNLKSSVYGIFCFKIGDYIINSTDNILISSIVDIITVGIYTNYLSITGILKNLIKRIFSSITSSFGNLSVQNEKESEYNVFKIMCFIGFVITGYVTLCFLNLINPFINIWLGKEFVFSTNTMIIICFNFYLMCSQLPLDTIKEAKGFYKKDRFIPIIQSIINIALSIILGINFGTNGILVATTISYFLTITWNKPYVLYKYLFEKSSLYYFIDRIKYLLIIVILYLIDFKLFNYINFSLSIFTLIKIYIIVTILYILTISILFYNRPEYKFLIDMTKKIFKKEGNDN